MSAKFTLEGSSAGAVQAIQQAADALDKTGKAAEGAAKSTRQLTTEAQRIKESIDPQEKLNRKYQELQQHVEAGRLSISQATAAGIKYRQELYAASDAGKAAAAAAQAAGEAAKRRADNERKSTQIQLESGQRLLRLEKEQAAAASQAAREQEQLAAAAQKIRESISPQEKLNRLTQELATHVKAGRLSIDEATAAHRKYRHELGLTVSAGDDVADSQDKAFGSAAISNLKGYLLGVVSIGTAISLVRSEIQEAVNLAERYNQTKLDAGAAEAVLRETASEDPHLGRMLAEAQAIAKARDLPVSSVYSTMENAYAAGGDADLAIRASREASQQTRDPYRMIETAAGIGDIIQSSRIKDEQEAAGFLALTQKTSRIKGEKVPGAVGKLVASNVAAGGTEAGAAALLSALSVAGVDPDGERARTAGVEMIGQTRAFFKKNARKYGINANDFASPDDRIAYLMGHPEMARQFLNDESFGANMSGAVNKLFMSADTQKLYRDAFSQNDEASERLTAAANRRRIIGEGALQSGRRSEDVIKASDEAFALGTDFTFSTDSREKLLGMLTRSGDAPMFMRRAALRLDTGVALDRDEAIRESEKAIRQAEYRTRFNPENITDDQKAAVAELRQVVAGLKELNNSVGSKVATRSE